MPGGPRAQNKELAAAALAGGSTIAAAALAAKVDPRTVAKWKADDSAFRSRVAELRAEMVSRALGKLSDTMSSAADVLVALLTDTDANVRLRSARAVIELKNELERVREQMANVE